MPSMSWKKEMNVVILTGRIRASASQQRGNLSGVCGQVPEQAAVLEDKYKGGHGEKEKFCVSTQHYSFAVNAFVDLIKGMVRMSMISASGKRRLMRSLKMWRE